jgi:ATP-binding cassette subfamily C (CFTR/MRP) protein 1
MLFDNKRWPRRSGACEYEPVSSTLMSVIIVWTKLETSIGAVARIHQFSFDTPREPEQEQPIPPPEGAVDFKNVTASYK